MVVVLDILTWTGPFSIYQMVLCHYHLGRWEDLARYKLLIIQMAHQYPGLAWFDFRKDAAVSGLTDRSKMNLDLYNFHLRTPQAPSTRQLIHEPRHRQALREIETRHHLPDIATRGMVVNVVGRWAGAVFATTANAATGRTPKSTAPISYTSDSVRAAPPQQAREVGPNLPQQQSVHSVNRTVCQLLCSVPVRGGVLLALRPLVGQGLPPVVVSSSSVSPLLPVGFVSPLVVCKFQI